MACFRCKSNNIIYLFNSEDYVTNETFKIYRCQKCNIDFPIPRPVNLDKYYPKLYRKYNFLVMKVFNFFYKQIANYINNFFINNNNKNKILLEIGCGDGLLLSCFKKKGWIVFGTERTAAIDNISAKQLNISDKHLSDFPNNNFDLIILNNSFEHLPDPQSIEKLFDKKLKKNGLLVINVPSANSIQYKFGKGHWYHLDAPRHLQIFDDKYFYNFSREYGFKIIKNRSIGFFWEFFGWFQTLLNKLLNNKNSFHKSISDLKKYKKNFLYGLIQFFFLGIFAFFLTFFAYIINRWSVKQFIFRKI